MTQQYELSEEKKINLVLENCVVKDDAFEGCMFVDNLTIDQGATVERYGFSEATIEKLIQGAVVNDYGFSRATITDLTINQGATVKRDVFNSATITETVKYDNDEIISPETLKNWGFGQQ